LRLRARGIVEGYLAGLHRSPYRGFSIEFAEHRNYTAGDDLRYLDWKVYGRTDKLYLKQFEDETNLVCYLVVDASESMSYRGSRAELTKFEYAQCIAASLAWLVLRQQDAVGLITFDGEIRDHVTPSSQASHLKHVIRTLENSRPMDKSAVGSFLERLATQIIRRGVIVLLSDFFDDLERILKGLHRLRLARHDVIALQVLDRDEVEFPFDAPTDFRGLEELPDQFADPRSVRRAYREEIEQFQRGLRRGCQLHEIDFRGVCTDQPPDRVLVPLLSRH
jgi:uncharacterized protein (DUF58 family)